MDYDDEMGLVLQDMAKHRPGWRGGFSERQAKGAIPNGTRIMKSADEKGDTHPVGSLGTVLGSMMHPERGFAYWIEWDAHPMHAVLVVGWKIAEAPNGS